MSKMAVYEVYIETYDCIYKLSIHNVYDTAEMCCKYERVYIMWDTADIGLNIYEHSIYKCSI